MTSRAWSTPGRSDGRGSLPSRSRTRSERQWEYEKWLWDSDYFRLVVPNLANIRPGARILNLRCGQGGMARTLYPLIQPDGEIIGLDDDVEAVESGNDYNAKNGFDRIKLLPHSALEAEDYLPPASFDHVASILFLMWTRYPEGFRKALDTAFRMLRPGGTYLSIEPDYPVFFSGMWKTPGIEEAQWEWMNVRSQGYGKYEGFKFRIAPEVPRRMIEAGFGNLRCSDYCSLEWFPPYPKWQVDAMMSGITSLTPGDPEMEYSRTLMRAVGHRDQRIDELARVQRAWFQDVVDQMKRGEMPTMNREFMLVTVGEKPKS